MSMRVTLLGASGLLGSDLAIALARAGVAIDAPRHRELDIADSAALTRFFTERKPDVVINSAGLINVDEAEEDPYPAWQVNALGAGSVARSLGNSGLPGVRLIHISTNYVFGDKKEIYDEDDIPAPINTYGETKAIGERLVAYYCKKAGIPYHVLRTCWLFSPSRKSFVDKVAQSLVQGDPVKAFSDQFGDLTYAPDLAQSAVDNFILDTQSSGIFHIVNSAPGKGSPASRYDIALAIARALEVPEAKVEKDSQKGFFKARRPSHALLRNTKLPPLPPWEDSLRAYIHAVYGQRTSL
jgi:dTDP-4-dehydrorhamnose reductase